MATRAGAIGNLPWVRGTSFPGVKMAPRGAQHKEAITAELQMQMKNLGIKKFIETYGSSTFQSISPAVTGGIIGYEASKFAFPTDEKDKEQEVSTQVEEQPPKLPEEPPKGPDIGTELVTEAAIKTTEKLLEKKDKPEFGKLTKAEKQTALALKEDQPDFYSRAVEAINNVKANKMPKEQWANILKGKTTKDELDYLGLTELLVGNESITKQELLKLAEGKDIAPNITVRSIPKDQMNPMHEGYTLGGAQEGTVENIVFQIGKEDVARKDLGQLYKEPHFDTEYGTNTFAHARIQVGFGNSDAPPADYEHLASEVFEKFNNTLIIDEIQSQWLQQGRINGFISDFEIVPGDQLVDYFKKHNISYKISGKQIEFQHKDDKPIESGDAPEIGPMNSKVKYIFRKSDNTEFTRWQPEKYEEDAKYSTVEEFLQKAYGKAPDFPVKESKKWVELVLNKMIEKAILDGRDSIAITNGQIQANRYAGSGASQEQQEGLKKFYDNTVFPQLEKIAKKYNVELERIDLQDPEQAEIDQKETQLEFPKKVKTAQEGGWVLEKITLQELWDRIKDTNIPGHTALYSKEGRGQGSDYIENYLSDAVLDGEQWNEIRNNEVYVWKEKKPYRYSQDQGYIREKVVWDMPIVPVADTITNPAVNDILNASSEDRDYIIRQFTIGGAAAYPYEGDNINNIDLIKYTEYLRNYKLPEGVDLGYDKDPEQLIKMKLPKKLQKERLSKPIRLTKAKQQTERLFA